MNAKLQGRLDKVLPAITNPDFLATQGIGNDIACYIFDYPPEAEPQIRQNLQGLVTSVAIAFACSAKRGQGIVLLA